MCNLYRMNRAVAEIANLFSVVADASNAPGDVYPGYPGLVVADGKVRSMGWGFPLSLKSKKTGEPLKPKPVNNARSDKLDTFMWKASFERRRCLIPVDAFAEAEGAKGRMTRTWISLPEDKLMVVAGIWRDSDEWGPVYSMVMTEACKATAEVHDRMPVILTPDDQERWLLGTTSEAIELCQPYAGQLAIERTVEPWVRRRA